MAAANNYCVRRLMGIGIGLSLLMPTLHYEANLFERVTRALDDGHALSAGELEPPVHVGPALETVRSFIHRALAA